MYADVSVCCCFSASIATGLPYPLLIWLHTTPTLIALGLTVHKPQNGQLVFKESTASANTASHLFPGTAFCVETIARPADLEDTKAIECCTVASDGNTPVPGAK